MSDSPGRVPRGSSPGPMRRPALLAAAFASVPLLVAGSAHADASSWAFIGGGASNIESADRPAAMFSTMQLDVGVGTTPDAPLIFGGLFRLAPVFGEGSDLGLLARVATHGFQAGGFGVAADVGGYARWWGTDSRGFQGGLALGAPFGLTLGAVATVGTNDAMGYGGTLGIDLLRLTVYRQSTLDYWPNPAPAQKVTAGLGALRF